MWQTEKGIVTGAIRHNDGISIVKIFTESHGMIPFIYYMSKSGNRTSRNTLIQPLTQIEFQTDYIPSSTLSHIRQPKNNCPYRDIPFNPLKRVIAMFIGEFLTYALSQESDNPGLYNYIVQSIKWLDDANDEVCSNFHILFALQTSSFIGISPNNDDYSAGKYLDLREGTFTASPPFHNDYVNAEISFKIASLMNCDFNNMTKVPLTGMERTAIINNLNLYFRHHIPSFPQLKSIEVLQSLFI